MLSIIKSNPASQVFNKSKAKSNTKQIITTIIFLAFIKNKHFAVHLNLVDVFFYPQVYFTALFADWNTGSPIVSIVMPLLFPVSYDISVDSGHAEIWWRSKDREPGWATECYLAVTCNNNKDHVDYK